MFPNRFPKHSLGHWLGKQIVTPRAVPGWRGARCEVWSGAPLGPFAMALRGGGGGGGCSIPFVAGRGARCDRTSCTAQRTALVTPLVESVFLWCADQDAQRNKALLMLFQTCMRLFFFKRIYLTIVWRMLIIKQLTVATDFHSIFFHNTEVNGYRQLFGNKNYSKFLLLCSTEETNSYIWKTWGWVYDDRIFIFGQNIPVWVYIFLSQFWKIYLPKHLFGNIML